MGANVGEKYCLKWNDFSSNLSLAFRELRDDEDFFDVTLVTEQSEIRCHKLVLGACSPHFRKIIKKLSGKPNPAIYLRGIEHKDIQNILEFMYVGEVNVAQEDLDSFLAAAQDLCIKGLTTTQENSQAKPARLSEPKSDRIQPPPPKRSKILPKPENHDIKKKSFDVVKQEPQVAGNNHQQPSEDLDTYDDYYEADTMEDNLGEDDSKDEQEELAIEINEYLTSMSGRTEEGRYRCLICGLTCRDLYNQREHLMTHMVRDDKFKTRLEKFMKSNVIKDPKTAVTTCLICQAQVGTALRKHFLSKHLREPKSTSYVQLPDESF